ncbi:MAG TPA: hypothetical protein VF883_14180, partial [Thermoanaerobaculia bacterium]
GGRVVGAMGWVVSAASKRYGGWRLWGMWTDGPVPALALPLCWPELSDPLQLPDLLRRANDDADALLRREAWPELLDRINAMRLQEDDFRATLKLELSRLYRAPQSAERPHEIDLPPTMLDLIPWIYLLGPVEPGLAQVQPSRFNGAGYQYILTDAAPAEADVLKEIDTMVDTAASDVLQGFRMASALRERRARPRRKTITPPTKPSESLDMRKPSPPPQQQQPSRAKAPPPDPMDLLPTILRGVRDLIVIALLSWIACEVYQIRKSLTAAAPPTPAVTTDTQSNEPEPEPEASPPLTREQRLAEALVTRPPQGIRVEAAAADNLPHAAVELFLRRNACFARTEPVDGKFSAAEQRAIRNCRSLTTARLMRSGIEPHPERTLDWLERTLAVR